MNYEKHIEALKEAKRNGRLLPDEHRAADAAIELMQAAQPKDAEAEIERLRAAYDTQLRRPYPSENELQKRLLETKLRNLRAAAEHLFNDHGGYDRDGYDELRAAIEASK